MGTGKLTKEDAVSVQQHEKEWNEIFDEDKRKELYREQKSSTTVVKPDKIYPNDPCPCGSGRKYKKCCGKKG